MPKGSDFVTWKVILVLVTIGLAAIGGCFAYTMSTAERCQDSDIKAEFQDFRYEQRRWNEKTEGKLDRILERLP